MGMARMPPRLNDRLSLIVSTPANIAAYLPKVAAEHPHAMAIAAPAGRDRAGRRAYTHLTYGQLDTMSDHIARGLEAHGIGRGVRTVLMVRPGLDLFALVFGMFKAGAVPILIDPGIGRHHLKACIANAEPEAFIGVPAAQVARAVFGWGRPTVKQLVTVGRRGPWGGPNLQDIEEKGQRRGGVELADVASDEMAAIVFTSGSTGPPKGVIYRHGNFLAQVEAIRRMFDLGPGEVDLPTFPLFALFDPALGMTTIIPDMDFTRPAAVDPRKIIEPIEDFGVTMMFGSPALLDTVGRYGEQHDIRLPTLKRVLSAGAPVAPSVIERFSRMLPPDARILTPYGASEALPVAVISSREILEETGARTDRGEGVCVGRAVPSIDLKVIEISDDPIENWDPELVVSDGKVGEIVVKGAQVTSAYYNAERHNRLGKIKDTNGQIRHRMGDLGYLDDDGRLWFVGRKSQRVAAFGKTLYTVPAEAIFNTHPAVFRSALVGVGEGDTARPVLCVELESGVTRNRDVITAELLDIGSRFEHTHQIRTVLFHPGFPVDIRHNAKIGRGQLADWASKKLRV